MQCELTRHRVTFVGQSYPHGATRRASGQYCAVYYRFHSVPELYKWHYSPEFLARIAAEVKAAKHEKQVYLFFNNGIGAVGMENARQMQQWL